MRRAAAIWRRLLFCQKWVGNCPPYPSASYAPALSQDMSGPYFDKELKSSQMRHMTWVFQAILINCQHWNLRLFTFEFWNFASAFFHFKTKSDLSLNLVTFSNQIRVVAFNVFTKKSNVAKCFLDICNAEMTQSLSSLQKSESLKWLFWFFM